MGRYNVALFDDVREQVDDDGYMWIVIWGPPRCSKTTLLLWILYSLYRDWNKVLTALVFNLPQAIYKIKEGLPEKWWTRNMYHHRVPAIGWDDFAVHSNKAVTQYSEAWDLFKGGFDALGTKIGVLIATMVDPTAPTMQIMSKYTHEVQILRRGVYKYDQVQWKQDFKGMKLRVKKRFIEENTFDPVPDWVYREYDKMRMSLADEVLVKIEDSISLNQTEFVMELLKPMDFQILELIEQRGPICYDPHIQQRGDEGKHALVRLKARGLVVPIRQKGKGYYKYDMTRFGLDMLKAYRKKQQEEQHKKRKEMPFVTA